MKTKTFIISAMIYIITLKNLFSQIQVNGTVLDKEDQSSLAGASVYIHELKISALTDKDGKFSFTKVPSGTYIFEVNLLGYKKYIQRIDIKKDTSLSINLIPSVTELNEVVITSVSKSTELKRSPVVVQSIDMQQINFKSSTNLIDALKELPNVEQITTGANISKPIIRGLGFNRIVTLYNGIRQEGQQWGEEHGIELDEYAIEKVEIVKGAGSLMYGSDAIGGVLNFMTTKTPPQDKIKTQVVSNYQSNNQFIGNSIMNSGNKRDFHWILRLSNKLASNYQNRYDGKIYNSGYRENDGMIQLGINKQWGFSHLNISSYNSIVNMPEGERDSLGRFIYQTTDEHHDVIEKPVTDAELKGYKIGEPRQQINHLRIQSNNLFLLKNGQMYVDIAYQNNLRREFGHHHEGHTHHHEEDSPSIFLDLKTFNYQLKYNFNEKKGWNTTIGINGMNQINKNKGEEYIIPDYQLFDAGIFMISQKSFVEKFHILGGIRLDNRFIKTQRLILDSLNHPVSIEDSTTTLKFKYIDKSYFNISGSIGMSYLIDDNSTMKLNISRGFRAPNIAELSSNGHHEGTFRYEIGNEQLKPEISHQLDFSYLLNSEHIDLEVSPFINFVSNYIYIEKLRSVLGGDSIVDTENLIPSFKFVQGNAMLSGGEIIMDVHPHPYDWLHVENSFSFVQAVQLNQTDSTKYLPFTPAPKYRGELRFRINKINKIFYQSYFKVWVLHYFEQNRIFSAYQTETKTPAYTLLNAGIGTHIALRNNKEFLTLIFSAENIGDVVYQNHLSRLKYAPVNPLTGRQGIFNMGRNFSVKVIFNF